MAQCRCSQPILEPTPTLLYILDFSQSHPQSLPVVHDIFWCHNACRAKHDLLLDLSASLSRVTGIEGFAEVRVEPRLMLDFLETYYGKASGWSKPAQTERKRILKLLADRKRHPAKHATLAAVMRIPAAVALVNNGQPTIQALVAAVSLVTAVSTLAGAAQWNPALLPSGTPGYVRVDLGAHPPILSGTGPVSRPFAQLQYPVSVEIPERMARGMLRYGHNFLKVVGALSSITTTRPWIDSNAEWGPEAISNFLCFVLSRKGADPAKLPQLLGSGFRRNVMGWSLSTVKKRITTAL